MLINSDFEVELESGNRYVLTLLGYGLTRHAHLGQLIDKETPYLSTVSKIHFVLRHRTVGNFTSVSK